MEKLIQAWIISCGREQHFVDAAPKTRFSVRARAWRFSERETLLPLFDGVSQEHLWSELGGFFLAQRIGRGWSRRFRNDIER